MLRTSTGGHPGPGRGEGPGGRARACCPPPTCRTRCTLAVSGARGVHRRLHPPLVLMVWSITGTLRWRTRRIPPNAQSLRRPGTSSACKKMLVYFDPGRRLVLAVPDHRRADGDPLRRVNPRATLLHLERAQVRHATFLVGFLGMWVGMITIGVFFRGPGWNLFMPGLLGSAQGRSAGQHRLHTSSGSQRDGRHALRRHLRARLAGGIPGAFWQWKKDAR